DVQPDRDRWSARRAEGDPVDDREPRSMRASPYFPWIENGFSCWRRSRVHTKGTRPASSPSCHRKRTRTSGNPGRSSSRKSSALRKDNQPGAVPESDEGEEQDQTRPPYPSS